MIYIETGSTDVYYNFALEYYLAKEKKLGDTAFLFWRTTPTLMVGKYQNTLEEIRRDYAEAHGIRVARRMSGGGTIYTDPGGWQFSFIARRDTDEIRFQPYVSPILGALREMGVPAEFSGRNDLLIGGRKISGNAQYTLEDSVVHHGSLLFDTDLGQMAAATSVSEEKIRSKSVRSVRERVTNISEHLARPMDAEAFGRRVVDSVMGDTGGRYELTGEDRAEIARIARETFASWEWIYGKNPRFGIVRARRFPGGRIEFRLEIRKGEIAEAAVSGDFFAGERADSLAEALIGCRYEREAVKRRLEERGLDGAVYGITADDMAATIAE